MSELIDSIERRQLRKELPRFREGDRLRVHFQVVEGTRRRTQVFEGVVIRLQGAGSRRTFTVRKLSFGVGVERTFPLHSPKVERLEVVARGEIRRAKLYYLRERIGRRARVRERRDLGPEELVMEVVEDGAGEAVAEEAEAEGALPEEAPADEAAAEEAAAEAPAEEAAAEDAPAEEAPSEEPAPEDSEEQAAAAEQPVESEEKD